MLTFDVAQLFETLEQCPGLQRKEWERNKSGVDRGMEAVFIQRAPRELATYALVRLRFQAMPSLWTACHNEPWQPADVRYLASWGRTQGPGGTALANVLDLECQQALPSPRRLAALASLKFYHCREDANAAIKSPWTEEGFARLATLDVQALLDTPCRGTFWRRKFDTVQRLVAYVRDSDFALCSDEAVVHALQSLAGVGEQTASMVALFWLGRPVPIVDMYLERLLRAHHLVPSVFTMSNTNKTLLRRHLLQGALAIADRRPEWTASGVLSCLYLWSCEVGRRYGACQAQSATAWPKCYMR